jgi:hypothetical protein
MNMDRIPKDRVGLGSTILLLDLELDVESPTSSSSPSWRTSRRAGLHQLADRPRPPRQEGRRQVTIEVPSGKKRFEVIELRTIHDK